MAAPDVLQVEQRHGLWHRGVHWVASEVRDYELDQFQVSVLCAAVMRFSAQVQVQGCTLCCRLMGPSRPIY